jgi:hypothetical protein
VAKNGKFVIDSSIVKWFLIELNSYQAIRLRVEFAMVRITRPVSKLLFYEVMSALRFSDAFKEANLVLAFRSLNKY